VCELSSSTHLRGAQEGCPGSQVITISRRGILELLAGASALTACGKAIQRLLIQGKPTEVQVNDGTVPETQASIHITRLEDPAQAPPGSSQSNPPMR